MEKLGAIRKAEACEDNVRLIREGRVERRGKAGGRTGEGASCGSLEALEGRAGGRGGGRRFGTTRVSQEMAGAVSRGVEI